MFLSAADLHDLTGYQQPKRQARVLDAHGIRYVLRADGQIRVTWEQVNQPGERGQRQRPNFEAARG